jgi:hypothetical protein
MSFFFVATRSNWIHLATYSGRVSATIIYKDNIDQGKTTAIVPRGRQVGRAAGDGAGSGGSGGQGKT